MSSTASAAASGPPTTRSSANGTRSPPRRGRAGRRCACRSRSAGADATAPERPQRQRAVGTASGVLRRCVLPRGYGAPEWTSRRSASRCVVPVRTLLVLLAFGSLVVLAVFSIGHAARRSSSPRSWRSGSIRWSARWCAAAGGAAARRWRCSPRCSSRSSAIVLVTAGPLWDQIVEFAHALPGLLGQI